jgi:hypothetical protein
MKAMLAAAVLALASTALPAQEVAPGTQVERITLQPGQSASFTLAPGFSHQLLRRAAPRARGAITVRYEVAGGQSTVTATSRTGYPLRFSVLADPDGDGGYTGMGEIGLPGDGRPVARGWPQALGPVNIGGFVGGPHGDNPHRPAS